MDTFPPGLRVRKLAGNPDDRGARYYPDHQDGLPSKRPWGGVVFVDELKRTLDQPLEAFTVPHDYVDREHWIERVNPSFVNRPAGPADDPYRSVHTLPHADALLFHMGPGVTLRYRVVRQPDKYDQAGQPTDTAGDPTASVDWFYVCELEGQEG